MTPQRRPPFTRRPNVVTCAAANCTEHALVDDLERADRMRGRWKCAQHQRPQPQPSVVLVDVACASPGCDQTTAVAQPHAAQLDGRWRCRRHYAGAWPR